MNKRVLGRNSVLKQEHLVAHTEVRQSAAESPPWYRKFLCCQCLQTQPEANPGVESLEINLFAEMRRMLPETARRKIEMWQELTDEQPLLDENKDPCLEPLLQLENASPVKTWPPRSPRNQRFAIKKSMISIPSVGTIEESEEEN